MPRTIKKTNIEKELAKEVKTLSKEVRKLKDLEFLRVFKNPWKFMFFSFLKGLMVGFGSILGASVLVGVFIYLLSQISFIPVIGDFIEDIILQVKIEKSLDLAPSSTNENSLDSEPVKPIEEVLELEADSIK